jgi:hypothetical protein
MDLDKYLASAQALDDVRVAIDRELGGTEYDHDAFAWLVVKAGTTAFPASWHTVTHEKLYVPGGGKLHAYFRADGDRFMVSDLGDAVGVLRRQCGLVYPWDRFSPCRSAAERLDVHMMGDAIELDEVYVQEAADLPAALCRVLLAAYWIAIGTGTAPSL